MKCSIAVLAALMVFSSGPAFAEEGVEIDVGIKTWWASYKTEDAVSNRFLTFDPVLLVGPAFEVELPSHLFFEGEYVMSVTDYEKTQGPVKLSADTKYLELAIGYYLIPEVGIFAGYKKESTNWNVSGPGAGFGGSMDLAGPMIGILGKYSFSKTFGVYASATYMMTKAENKEPTGTIKEDAPGTDYQLAVKAKLGKAFTGSLGYRIESSKGQTSNVKDTFSGVTLDVMYAF